MSRAGFSLWGKPTLGGGVTAQLDARSETGGETDSVSGFCYFGTSVDREWFVTGRFSLMRDSAAVDGADEDEELAA